VSEDPVGREVLPMIGKKLDELFKLLRVVMLAEGSLGAKVDGVVRQLVGLSRRTDRISAHMVSVEEETIRGLEVKIERGFGQQEAKLNQILARLEKQT
jgi:hypothetical protein